MGTLDVTKLEELVKELDDKNDELSKSNTLLVKSNEELTHFAFIASHDLKAPLRAIHNITMLMDEDLKDHKDISNYTQMINQRIIRMNNLISALLEYSRIGKNHIEKEQINIIDIIKEVEKDLQIAGFK